MKINYIGLVSVVLAVASLAMPWLSATMTSDDNTVKMQFNAYLYQVQGTVNGTSANAFPNLWFIYGALALTVLVVAGSLAGSLLSGRRGLLLLLLAGILSLLAMTVFGVGLSTSNFGNVADEPKMAMDLFPSNAFGMTSADAMQNWYDISWFFSYGFWLALGAAIMGFVGAVAPALTAKKIAAPSAEQKTVDAVAKKTKT